MSKPAPPREGYRAALARLAAGDAHRSHRPELSAGTPAYWAEPGAHIATPFYGYGHVEVVTGHGDAVGGDYRAWLRDKDPAALDLLGPENSAAARLRRAAGLSHPRFRRSFIRPTISAERAEAYLKRAQRRLPIRSF